MGLYRFFGMAENDLARSQNDFGLGIEGYYRRERAIEARALELARKLNYTPYHNIAPLVDLVRNAQGMGLDVVVRPTDEVTESE